MSEKSVAEYVREHRAWCQAEVLRINGRTWREILEPTWRAAQEDHAAAMEEGVSYHAQGDEVRWPKPPQIEDVASDGAVWFEAGEFRMYGVQSGKLNKANNREAAILSIAAGNFPNGMSPDELHEREHVIAVHAEAIRKDRRRRRNRRRSA